MAPKLALTQPRKLRQSGPQNHRACRRTTRSVERAVNRTSVVLPCGMEALGRANLYLSPIDCLVCGPCCRKPNSSAPTTSTPCAARPTRAACGRAICFAALPGDRYDGHQFIAEAIRRGAASVLCERPPAGPERAVRGRAPRTPCLWPRLPGLGRKSQLQAETDRHHRDQRQDDHELPHRQRALEGRLPRRHRGNLGLFRRPGGRAGHAHHAARRKPGAAAGADGDQRMYARHDGSFQPRPGAKPHRRRSPRRGLRHQRQPRPPRLSPFAARLPPGQIQAAGLPRPGRLCRRECRRRDCRGLLAAFPRSGADGRHPQAGRNHGHAASNSSPANRPSCSPPAAKPCPCGPA